MRACLLVLLGHSRARVASWQNPASPASDSAARRWKTRSNRSSRHERLAEGRVAPSPQSLPLSAGVFAPPIRGADGQGRSCIRRDRLDRKRPGRVDHRPRPRVAQTLSSVNAWCGARARARGPAEHLMARRDRQRLRRVTDFSLSRATWRGVPRVPQLSRAPPRAGPSFRETLSRAG